MLPKPVVVGIALLVSFVWAANFVVDVLTHRGDGTINALFGIVISSIFYVGARRKVGSRKDRDDDPS
jgi:hypothetical protein